MTSLADRFSAEISSTVQTLRGQDSPNLARRVRSAADVVLNTGAGDLNESITYLNVEDAGVVQPADLQQVKAFLFAALRKAAQPDLVGMTAEHE